MAVDVPKNSKDLGVIWCIGDSITQSNLDGDSNGSVRKSLYDKLTAAGFSFAYTGHHNHKDEGLPPDEAFTYHSGVSGAFIGNDYEGNTGISANICAWWSTGRLATVKPNIILIMLGANDMDVSYDVQTAPQRLSKLLDTIYSFPSLDNPHIFLANITPNRSSASATANVLAYNKSIPGVVEAYQCRGKKVTFVDQFHKINASFAGNDGGRWLASKCRG